MVRQRRGKRGRNDFEVPVKYGLYECARLDQDDLQNWYLTEAERDAKMPV